MLHIIACILKIIGIILLILFLLLLFTLCSSLFVPVRYQLTASKIGDEYYTRVKANWFLHILSVFIQIEKGKKPELKFRLFGIQPGIKKKVRKKKQTKNKQQTDTVLSREIPPKKEFVALEDTIPREKTKKPAESAIQRKPTQKKQKTKFIKHKSKREKQKPNQAKERLKKLKQKVLELELDSFLPWFKRELASLLHHFRLRKAKGYIKFGTGDPSTTGEITGLFYCFLPYPLTKVSVVPNFTEAELELTICGSGHIRAVHFVTFLWHAFRNKTIRKMWKLRKGE